jgi:hypothetical protein
MRTIWIEDRPVPDWPIEQPVVLEIPAVLLKNPEEEIIEKFSTDWIMTLVPGNVPAVR